MGKDSLPSLSFFRGELAVSFNGGMFLDFFSITLPETNITPENRLKPNRKVVFQPSILWCNSLVSGRVVTGIFGYGIDCLPNHWIFPLVKL